MMQQKLVLDPKTGKYVLTYVNKGPSSATTAHGGPSSAVPGGRRLGLNPGRQSA